MSCRGPEHQLCWQYPRSSFDLHMGSVAVTVDTVFLLLKSFMAKAGVRDKIEVADKAPNEDFAVNDIKSRLSVASSFERHSHLSGES